ncbi:MAG: hypothetical protein ACJAS1_007319 [Oleiphilaceae bacterium]|jgi:hypothetical protein
MTENNQNINVLDDSSPSVQAHLAILQGVINRMQTNSSQCKAWCIAIVSAVLVIIADKGKPDYVWIALFPAILFAFLDIYYLVLEKGFRESYNNFVRKIHQKTAKVEDLYAVKAEGDMQKHRTGAMASFSIWGFYIGLVLLISITRYVALT